jgi:hypothetical protein
MENCSDVVVVVFAGYISWFYTDVALLTLEICENAQDRHGSNRVE